MLKCMCTNGLVLEDRLSEIESCGIRSVTVAVNATSADIGKDIYSWVRYNSVTYRGEEAASLLISKQFGGIKKAIESYLPATGSS